jgi:NurA-like 5'-3' nuclease
VSEDSTSRGLIGYLSEKGLSKEASRTLSSLTDASLIQLYTQRLDDFTAMATKPFLPVSNKGRDWVKKNTGIEASFPTFYLQATRMGRALRVDFPSDGKSIGKEAKGIASLLTYLSQIPKRYGYPLPLYLAHSDAELPQKLMERTTLMIQKQIFKNWSQEYVSMYSKRRRDSRPTDLE